MTGQLIRAATDEHVWAETMDRELTDVFAIQSELAQKIAAALQTVLSPREKKLISQRPTENTAAYDLYLKARAMRRNNQTVLEQEKLLQEAVVLDPNFIFGWTQLTIVHSDIYNLYMDRSEARLAKAKAAIDTAIRLAPEEPEVIRALGEFYFHGYRDFVRAVGQLQKLIELQPNDPNVYSGLGFVQRRQGRWADAVANFRKAVELDPGDLRVAASLADTLERGRRYEEAIVAWRRVFELHPGDLSLAYRLAYVSFLAHDSTREVEAFFAGLNADEAASPNAITLRRTWAQAQGNLAATDRPDARGGAGPLHQSMLLAAQGEQAAARSGLEKYSANRRVQLAQEPTNDRYWSQLGIAEAVSGHPEEALRCARKAVELVPDSLDAVSGPANSLGLAFVYAWTGDTDRAIAEYARLMRFPWAGLNVHAMRHELEFFPLRGDPLFEALLNDPKNNEPLF
ncbi:MAG: tetratricopeptide repeat protein [Opitutus sp.]|nr:tetratricopeptide repeat protein [Opitutus sp.]